MKTLNLVAVAALLGGSLSLGACGQNLDKSVSVDCSGFAGWTEIEAFWIDKIHKKCGYQDANGVLHISQETMKYFKPTHFEEKNSWMKHEGLMCSTFRLSDGTGGFGYLAPDGRARISNFPYDNACQPFGNGVAISYMDGKAIFFDKNLEVVKATDYDLADPF